MNEELHKNMGHTWSSSNTVHFIRIFIQGRLHFIVQIVGNATQLKRLAAIERGKMPVHQRLENSSREEKAKKVMPTTPKTTSKKRIIFPSIILKWHQKTFTKFDLFLLFDFFTQISAELPSKNHFDNFSFFFMSMMLWITLRWKRNRSGRLHGLPVVPASVLPRWTANRSLRTTKRNEKREMTLACRKKVEKKMKKFRKRNLRLCLLPFHPERHLSQSAPSLSPWTTDRGTWRNADAPPRIGPTSAWGAGHPLGTASPRRQTASVQMSTKKSVKKTHTVRVCPENAMESIF